MLKKIAQALSISCLIGIASGCSDPAAVSSPIPSASNASTHQHEETNTPQPGASPAGAYTLDASVDKQNGKYYLTVATNWKLSAEHYEGAPAAGEGHIHFYLNGVLIGPIKELTPYPLEQLAQGSNTIRLVLAQNNHTEDVGVTKELTFENK